MADTAPKRRVEDEHKGVAYAEWDRRRKAKMEDRVNRIDKFSIHDLKAQIPEHCFKRDFRIGMFFVLRNIAMTYATYKAYDYLVAPTPFGRGYLYPIYWVLMQLVYLWVQGNCITGFFVLGHECNHHAFCETDWLSDFVGFCCHQAFLTPYFAWQFSHKVHHGRCMNALDGEGSLTTSCIPPNSKRFKNFEALGRHRFGEEIFGMLEVIKITGFGWWGYMLFGWSGARRSIAGHHYKPWGGNVVRHTHFYYGKMFEGSGYPRWKIELSALTTFIGICLVGYWAYIRGPLEPFRIYLMPVWLYYFWIGCYAFTHHKDYKQRDNIPWYDDKTWSFFRGALGTCDHDFGYLEHFHHRIGSTHVCHHLFSKIPHYNAKEATVYIKQYLGDLYVSNTEDDWMTVIYKTSRDCFYIDNVKGINLPKGIREINAMREEREQAKKAVESEKAM